MASQVKQMSQKSSFSSQNDKVLANYLPLQMLKEKKTEMYVKFAKLMVIAQGIHGEDTFDEVKTVFNYTSCVLSDKSFMKDCHKTCLPDTTEEFYRYLKYSSQKALEEGNNLLVIDSTMSNTEQNRFYIALAYKMQYVILVVPPIVIKEHSQWPKYSFASSFFIKTSTVIQPTNMFQHLFCAWYLHDNDSYELRNEISLYLQDCLKGIPKFKNVIQRNCLVQDDENDSDCKKDSSSEEFSLIDAIKDYYNLNDKRQDIAFCAVKIFGNSMKIMNEYFKKESVQSNFGKISKLYITGFIVTPNILAARVHLTRKQVDLWEREEVYDEHTVTDKSPIVGPFSLLQESKQDLPNVDNVRLIASKSNPTLINTGNAPSDPLKSIPHYARGRACHIVLGRVKNAPTYQIDFGVQFALNREDKMARNKEDFETVELERCVVKQIGKYWFIYLRENLSVDAFFSSCVKPYPFDDPIKY
ncbi:uncharacterized protein CDAR_516851 [Caerostris darwini]|uniref:Cyclic nucleotide phosphodiesterase catalytic domain-containing protein n=1 Tax=Caerostris darwini TaxID=1538125 RepID=A0AAV4UDX6_9ARAC|nr:uncharacterized protein CDAR_516851 [Caerostris darwini]